MVSGTPCPPWEYEDVAGFRKILALEISRVLLGLRLGLFSVEAEGVDTRPTHGEMFAQLAPPAMPYFAGHYRGEPFHCLDSYNVFISTDPLVGVHFSLVAGSMEAFSQDLVEAVQELDAAFADSLTEETKLYFAVRTAASLFQEFLTIHPYANGNGHVARFLVWLLLGRYGYWPETWTIEPQPAMPGYSFALYSHRRGQEHQLEKLILQAITGK